MRIPRAFEKPAFHIVLIALLGLLAYSNTFEVPFQWDKSFIQGNPIIKDLTNFLEPSKAEGLKQHDALRRRYIGYLTFAFNYRLHGLSVAGYHVFNNALHVLNALLVYLLVVQTFKTPFLRGTSQHGHIGYTALFASLFFVLHPVQTEAVTYIFQRLASLVTFFYLGSLVFYAKWRLLCESEKGRRGESATVSFAGAPVRFFAVSSFYALSLLFAVLAMKTKENAFTLPFVIALYEFLFFDGSPMRRMLRLSPILLTLFIIPLTLVGTDKPPEEIIAAIESSIRGVEGTAKGAYFLTQLRVLVTYGRLLLLPINQNLYYDYPLYNSFSDAEVILSLLCHLSVFALAVFLLCRSRYQTAALRVLAFGIFWFYVTLSVESSVIPLPMVINEYRVYLPSVGAFFAATSGAMLLLKTLRNDAFKAVFASALVLMVASLFTATYARNNIWRDELTLWNDVVKKSYGLPAGHINLGVAYASKGMIDEATKHYLIALKMEPNNAEAHNNLGNAYAAEGLTDKAIEHYLIALKLEPNNAEAHNNLAVAYNSKGLFGGAIDHYKAAISLRPDLTEARLNLGVAYLDSGSRDEARREFEAVLQIDPNNPKAARFLNYIDEPGAR